MDSNELTLEEYKKIATNLRSNLRSLMISGGEPSLRSDLPEICRIFYDRCSVKKLYLPLNGHNRERTTNLIEKILNLCPAVQLNAGLSVDGIGPIHDIQRGVSGSFNKVMDTHEGLFKMSKRYPNLKRGIITTVTSINVRQIGELTNYIFKLPSRPDYHDIMVCRIQAGSKTNRELLIKPDEYDSILRITNRYALFYSRKRYNSFVLGIIGYMRHKLLNYIYMNAYKNRQTINCKAPELIRVMEADGRVRICELSREEGNIKNYDYDLNKMDEGLALSSKRPGCACTHPCFVVPSLRYPSNIIKCCASIFADKIGLRRK